MASEGSVAVEEERISFSSVESKMASSRLPVEEESARARLQKLSRRIAGVLLGPFSSVIYQTDSQTALYLLM